MIRTTELAAFRAEVRAFLEASLPAELKGVSDQYHCADKAAMIRWKDILRNKGWLAAAWPVEFGGCGWSEQKQWIFRHECARARAPLIDMHGIRMVGPAVCRFGTDWQRREFLTAILDSRHWWCQGFSEPGAGSDLAGLRTKATRTGDDYLIAGEKIWTTYAHIATHMFTLVRTGTGGKAQDQLSLLLIPLDIPGISVFPIVSIDNQHHFNRVVLDNVRVAAQYRLGMENEGWAIARFLLETERVAGAASDVCASYLNSARSILATMPVHEDTVRQFAALQLRYETLMALELRAMAGASADANPALTSALKIDGADLQKDVAEFCLKLLGQAANQSGAPAGENHSCPGKGTVERFMYSRAASIYGGSNEIQKGIVARALGL